MGANFKTLCAGALADIGRALSAVDTDAVDAAANAMAAARHIVCYGVGREGLMMRALSMRLYHMGLQSHVVGDMSCPPIGPRDLLLVSAGPGDFSTVRALIEVAKNAGAHTLCITAQPNGPAPSAAETILVLPAQTMADDGAETPATILPMGSLYEGAQYIAFEVLVLLLREKLVITAEAMRARHTNLE